MRPIRIEVLTSEEKQAIHTATVDVLDSAGFRVRDNRLRSIMRAKGAIVDDLVESVKLSPELIKEFMSLKPRRFSLFTRSGKELPVPTMNAYIGTRLLHPWILDYGRERPRKPEQTDIVAACQIANYFDDFDVVFMVESPVNDFDPHPDINLLFAIKTIVTHTKKHIYCLPINEDALLSWLKIIEAIEARYDLGERPVITVGVSPTSPLQLDGQSARVLTLAASRGLPILPASMVGGGGTGPITIAGELVLMNAEALFIIIAAQMIHPGCPCFYGGIPATMDMRTGIMSGGSPELAPMTTASLEMGRFYDLPLFSATKYTDTFISFDEQHGVEKVMAAFAALAGGTDVLYGCGDADLGTVLSLEQMIIDLDIILTAKRFVEGIIIDRDHLAVETICRVGPGGHFLVDPHTMKFLRSDERFSPRTYNRMGKRCSAKPQFEKAHEIVDVILKQEIEPQIDTLTSDRLDHAVAERLDELRANHC